MDAGRFDELIRAAFEEDLASAGDLTSESIFSADHISSALLVARQDGVVAGLDLAARVFHLLDDTVEIEAVTCDGSPVQTGSEWSNHVLGIGRAQWRWAPASQRLSLFDRESLCRPRGRKSSSGPLQAMR